MKDYSRVLTIAGLLVLFLVTLQIQPLSIFRNVDLSPGIWIAFGVAVYFGVLRKGGCCWSRRCSTESTG